MFTGTNNFLPSSHASSLHSSEHPTSCALPKIGTLAKASTGSAAFDPRSFHCSLTCSSTCHSIINPILTTCNNMVFVSKCDRIWENPPYGICARFAQCAFLVAQVEICQSPDFVIYMSNNPSSNCCRLLRRLVVLYEGEISLHFNPPSRHSRRTRSLLLWAVIRIIYLETARFINLLYVRSPF